MSSRCFASAGEVLVLVLELGRAMTQPINSSDDRSRRALVRRGHRALRAAEREAPRRSAEWLLGEVIDCDRGKLYAHPKRQVSVDDAREYWALVERCVKGEPLQHVLGYTSFRGLRIDVSPDVMIPRPETEELVEVGLSVISEVDAPHVLDVGTGSGCIALAIKAERPDAEVAGWDVSADALRVARRNREKLALQVSFSEVDILSEDTEPPSTPLDLLISNPPYIPRGEADTLSPLVREYDPDLALFSGDDPLRFYRVLADRAADFCADGAAVVLETHAEHATEAATVLQNAGLSDVSITEDISGRPRIVSARHTSNQARS